MLTNLNLGGGGGTKKKCGRQDAKCDSDHGVLISGKVAPEAGSTKTDGNMVHRFPYEASHTTRNLFMRWLSECNATNLGLMKNTGAEWQQRRLSAISKRIFERPDVVCNEFNSTAFVPKEHLMRLHGDFYTQELLSALAFVTLL